MHFFNSLNYLVDPDTISNIHIGNEGPSKDFFGNFKCNGKINTTINFKDGRSISLVSSELSYENKAKKYEETVKEITEYFDPSKEPKVAKEEATEAVLNAEPKINSDIPVEKTII